ncbi:phycobilisome rod-core linker polypeptide [Cylindrospermum sp. FACHB-282]|uniref:phycobilisome rod-core linker polypeptide n=1 Tax=Cylindrospermum sp. FACHB-282 TaxID=2692794 RepID=UPI001685DE40|nr:phycobilisome rod-core linker polypeptide [Cylindrospermum sp. FACHB-282]MBD2385889.1 phycobilisome rod-core linker polypeptide [Cylindrospermum sp. FACHB-282]
MSIPLLDYKPSSQNQRVPGYEVPNEDTPRPYRIEDYAFGGEVQELIWAAYRQVFSEHVILKFYRQGNLESQLKNKAITVRDFIRGLAKSEAFQSLVIKTNSNYRLVELALKRFLGRAPYNKDEEISWSIKIATLGWGGFIDALLDSEEYQTNFGENIVPYQRRRYKDRPFNLVTPRYGNYWRDKLESERYKTGDIKNFLELASSIEIKTLVYTTVNTANITIPDTTRETKPKGIPVSINTSANFPVR